MYTSTREHIGETLTGDVLEVGPGSAPFPTAPGARVKYADRSVEGGRDLNWPELIGRPPGIDPDYDVDLDIDGLSQIAACSFDAVIACHVLEHLANPVRAIREFERVLRPGGKLVLVIPNRTQTFDAVRVPTELAHVIREFREKVTEVSDAHIVEFCRAIYEQPTIHPDEVREWHNPAKINGELLSLHRRRSIHVHCWAPEEFAVLIAGLLSHGLIDFELSGVYFSGAEPESAEFGLVLERARSAVKRQELVFQFIRSWISEILSDSQRNLRRIVKLQQAICRDINEFSDPFDILDMVSAQLIKQLDAMQREIDEQTIMIADRDSVIDAMTQSISWRYTAPLRKVRNLLVDFARHS